MNYKGKNVESIQLVCYMGDEFKNKSFQENQKYFKEQIKGRISFDYSFECPIEDMICINYDGLHSNTKEGKEKLLYGLEELNKIFPNSFINLYLDDFVEEGNCIDLTGEKFRELYC